MNQPIRTAAVLGAGVMGAGIAAHLANAGCQVLLLDIVPPGLPDAERALPAARNRFAAAGLERALKSKPTSAFYHPSRASLVSLGNLEDDLPRAARCDLIIEAIVEALEPKRALYARLEPLLGPHTVVASNTSGLRIAHLLEGRGEAFRRNFMVIHFFNPPRHMKLLELVPGVATDPAAFARVRRFGEDALGKGVVVARDTPNFIGNRIGAQAMMACIHQMLDDRLAPEDVDAVAGPPLGRPKSAAFRTADLVGLDTFAHVANNCFAALTDDEDRAVFELPEYVRDMVEKKLLGDKTRGGFYRKAPQGGGIETYDPYTRAYRAKGGDAAIARFAKGLKDTEDPVERLRATFRDPGPAGTFAWKVLRRTLSYAARRLGEISDDVGAIDDAMRWGYNWELGPFQTWDALGFAAVVDRMVADGVALPEAVLVMRRQEVPGWYRGSDVYSLSQGGYVPRTTNPRTRPLSAVARGAPVLENAGAVLRDVGDGVAALTFKTKMNSVDPDAIELLDRAVDRAEADFQALVLYNEGEHFCVGANLMLVVMAAMQGEWEQLRGMVQAFQRANQRLRYARVPVVAAPFGMTLGGGLELCLGAGAAQAAAETYAGLVEVGVGLVPAGGGCMNLLWRALDAQPEGAEVSALTLVTQVFKNIALAKVATSADEARHLGYLRPSDGVTFDRARLLHDARERALGLARAGWRPPAPRAYKLPGQSGIATLKMMVLSLQQAGQASAHDGVVALRVAEILCGGVDGAAGPVSEDRMLELEAENFVRLCGEEKSRERMQYMLMNNKPLRN